MSIALLPPDQQELMRLCLDLEPEDRRAAIAERLDAAIADHYRAFPEESDYAARVLTYRIEEAFDPADGGERDPQRASAEGSLIEDPSEPIPF